MSEKLLQIVRRATETNIDNSLTGDELWLYYNSTRGSALRTLLFDCKRQEKVK
jgi:hypothetical protein